MTAFTQAKVFRHDSIKLMSELLPLTQERFLQGERILEMVERFIGKGDSEAYFAVAFYFLNGLSEIVRLLPVGLYESEDMREGVLNAFAEAKDLLAQREDEALEE